MEFAGLLSASKFTRNNFCTINTNCSSRFRRTWPILRFSNHGAFGNRGHTEVYVVTTENWYCNMMEAASTSAWHRTYSRDSYSAFHCSQSVHLKQYLISECMLFFFHLLDHPRNLSRFSNEKIYSLHSTSLSFVWNINSFENNTGSNNLLCKAAHNIKNISWKKLR